MDKINTDFIDSRRQYLSQPCIDLNNPNIRKMLLQNKGRFEQGYFRGNLKIIINIRWNKERLMFKCSIVILEKQDDESWKHKLRFDDSHGFRHADACMDFEKVKIPSGKFTLAKVECPILCILIDTLPKEKADAWKTKLSNEFEIGVQKWKEFLDERHKKYSH